MKIRNMYLKNQYQLHVQVFNTNIERLILMRFKDKDRGQS